MSSGQKHSNQDSGPVDFCLFWVRGELLQDNASRSIVDVSFHDCRNRNQVYQHFVRELKDCFGASRIIENPHLRLLKQA